MLFQRAMGGIMRSVATSSSSFRVRNLRMKMMPQTQALRFKSSIPLSAEPVSDATPFAFKRLTFLGGGAMAEAILKAVLNERLVLPGNISVYDINEHRLDFLKDKYGIAATSTVGASVKNVDCIIIACKPQNLTTLYGDLEGCAIPEHALLLSICAGVPLKDFMENTPLRKIVRCMPNSPCTIREGMTVWCTSDDVNMELKNSVARFLECLGKQQYVKDERFIDCATAISGSGPAYVLLIIESLIDSAVHMGMGRDMAKSLVLQTVFGTTLYAMKSNLHPSVLRNEITSPGGTTASALYVMEKWNVRTALSDSVWAAYRRSLELGGSDSNVGPGRATPHNHQN